MRSFFRVGIALTITTITVFILFHYRALLFGYPPCTQPVTYSLGVFDQRFGISQAQFLDDLSRASLIWSSSLNRPLFEYKESGGEIIVNLSYDYRQKATGDLQTIGIAIRGDQATYDQLKAKYDSLALTYEQNKKILDQKTSLYDNSKKAYDQEVTKWNDRGGAPADRFAALEKARSAANTKLLEINQGRESLNKLAETINATAKSLNQLAQRLNLNVKTYNTIGASTGGEFDEGQYVRDEDGRHIDIYQFENKDKLIRVLTHEFGHALGMDHVDDPEAIMYRLNQSHDSIPTTADLTELKRVCRLQ